MLRGLFRVREIRPRFFIRRCMRRRDIAHCTLLLLDDSRPTKYNSRRRFRYSSGNGHSYDFFPGNRAGIAMESNYQTSAQPLSRQQVSTLTSAGDGTVRTVTLLVGGQRISIRTDQNPDYLNGLAAEVNALVESLRQASPGSGMPVLMALAAVQLADRAISAEQAVERENLKVERHIERLSGILRSLEAADLQS